MNNFQQIQAQLNEINTQRVRMQTLVEQAQKQCSEIEAKYNVKSAEELKALVDKAQLEYEQSLKEAQTYIEETNKVLSTYQGIL